MAFSPFFTLVEDNDIHHPAVHYVFEDDEQPTTLAISRHDQRVLVVDVSADGRTVRQAASLSDSWQGVRARIEHAPTFGDSGKDGLMLMVTGIDAQTTELPQNASLDDLLAAFDREMKVLEELVKDETDRQAEQSTGLLQKWDH